MSESFERDRRMVWVLGWVGRLTVAISQAETMEDREAAKKHASAAVAGFVDSVRSTFSGVDDYWVEVQRFVAEHGLPDEATDDGEAQ